MLIYRNKIFLLLALLPILILGSGCAGVAWIRAISTQNNETKSYLKNHKSGKVKRIKGARSMPPSGKGFTTYSTFLAALGRQHAHDKVIKTLISAFASASQSNGTEYVVAEIGWPDGRSLEAHASHKLGLYVDILTPVRDAQSKKTKRLSTHISNLWGYCWKIDAKSHLVVGKEWEVDESKMSKSLRKWIRGPYCPKTNEDSGLEVDFEAMKDLIINVRDEAKKNNLVLQHVIVDRSFIRKLKGTKVPLLHDVWVRHDEHLHFKFQLK